MRANKSYYSIGFFKGWLNGYGKNFYAGILSEGLFVDGGYKENKEDVPKPEEDKRFGYNLTDFEAQEIIWSDYFVKKMNLAKIEWEHKTEFKVGSERVY